MATEVGEVIQAVAVGATESVRALREAGLTVGMDAFDVEVDFVAGPDHDGAGEVSATLRLRLNVVVPEAGRGNSGGSGALERLVPQPS